MKNLFKFVWFTAAVLSLISASAMADDAKVVVRVVSGEVKISRAGQSVASAPDSELLAMDQITTEDDSAVDIAWNNQWGYRLLSNSRCVLKSIDKQNTQIEMESGDIIFNIKELPKDGKLEVITPVAVAAVRGTQFWGRVDGKDVTLAVREGTVEVTLRGTGEVYKLQEGQAIDVKRSTFVLPRKALEIELKAIAQADEIPVTV